MNKLTTHIIQQILTNKGQKDWDPEIQQLMDQDPSLRKICDELLDAHLRKQALQRFQQRYNTAEAHEVFLKHIAKSRKSGTFMPTHRWMGYAAAAVLLIVGFNIYYYFGYRKQPSAHHTQQVADIAPGTNRAILTLADGKTIHLDSTQTGIVIGDNSIKYANGNLVTAKKGDSQLAPEPAARSLLLATPKGGQYQITLSDGTRVWLNAASTFIYPSQFTRGKREVEIEGEAFFQVAHQEAAPYGNHRFGPFIVKSKGQEIRVLGTEFNVNSYDPLVKTTLASGALQVSLPNTLNAVLLKPGEQSILNQNGSITKSNTDIQMATAWKNGKFYFKKTPLNEVLQQISRWYDIEIAYKNTIPTESFSGTLKRNVSLLTIMEFLKASEITFHLEGKKLIIE